MAIPVRAMRGTPGNWHGTFPQARITITNRLDGTKGIRAAALCSRSCKYHRGTVRNCPAKFRMARSRRTPSAVFRVVSLPDRNEQAIGQAFEDLRQGRLSFDAGQEFLSLASLSRPHGPASTHSSGEVSGARGRGRQIGKRVRAAGRARSWGDVEPLPLRCRSPQPQPAIRRARAAGQGALAMGGGGPLPKASRSRLCPCYRQPTIDCRSRSHQVRRRGPCR